MLIEAYIRIVSQKSRFFYYDLVFLDLFVFDSAEIEPSVHIWFF